MSVHSHYRAGLWHPYEKPMYGVLLNPYHPLAHGLVGCWLFNEGGGNTVFDLSGYGNHGTLGGGTAEYYPAWTAGSFGSALSFDGDNDYVDCGHSDSLAITDAITIVAWVKIADPDMFRHMRIVSKKSTWDASSGYELEYEAHSNYLTLLGSGSEFARAENVDLDTNWHFLAGTINGTNGKLYVDGVDKTTDNTVSALVASEQDLHIGKQSGGSDYWNGHLSVVMIYKIELSAREIWQLYTDPFCMFYHPALQAELLYATAPPAGIVPQAMHHYRMLREV